MVFLEDTVHVNKDLQGKPVLIHFMLSLDWVSFFSFVGVLLGFAVILPFVLPYCILENSDKGVVIAFRDSFFLAATTMGNMFVDRPTSPISRILVFVQLVLTFLVLTLQLGMSFVKVASTNTASMRWSNDCLVTIKNGRPVLTVRVCVEPFGTPLLLPGFSMWLVRASKDGWPTVVEQEELKVTSKSPSFAEEAFTLEHILSEDSPLTRFWSEKFQQADNERCLDFKLVICMSAFAELYRKDVRARVEYDGTDFVFGRRFKQMAFASGNGMQLNFDNMDKLEDTDTQDWPVAPTTTTTTITAPEVVSWVKSIAPPRPPPRPSPGCCRQLTSPYAEFKKNTLSSCCCNSKKKSSATQRADVVHTQGFRVGRKWAGVIADALNRIMRLDLCAMTLFLFVAFALMLLFMAVFYAAGFPLDYNPMDKNKDKCGNHSVVEQTHIGDPAIYVVNLLTKTDYPASFYEYLTGAALESVFGVGFEDVVPVNADISYDVTRSMRSGISVVWMNVVIMMLNTVLLALFWSTLTNEEAQVRLSQSALITVRNGKAYVLIQAVPQWMPHPVVSARVKLFASIAVKGCGVDTCEGMGKQHTRLALKQETFPVFVLGAAIVHEIDDESPLAPLLPRIRQRCDAGNLGPESAETKVEMMEKKVENVEFELNQLLVVLQGWDSCLQADNLTRRIYGADSIVYGGTVEPMLSIQPRKMSQSKGVVPESSIKHPLLSQCVYLVDNHKMDNLLK